MRGSETDKLARRYDLGLLPESGKMFLIAGHQIVRTRGVRTFQEHIVRGISCCLNPPVGDHGMTVVLNELQPRKGSNLELFPDQVLPTTEPQS